MKFLVSVSNNNFSSILLGKSLSPEQALSLILCWGLHASAETELQEEAPGANELQGDVSWGDLEDAFDDGQDEQLSSREGG